MMPAILEADANRPSWCVGFGKNPLLLVRTEATACQHFTCGSENSVIQAGDANVLPGGALFAPTRKRGGRI